MVMGFFQLRTQGAMPVTRMGVRNTVPSSMARMVPLGLFHILLQVVFLHPLGVGRDGGALDGHAVLLAVALAASTVT